MYPTLDSDLQAFELRLIEIIDHMRYPYSFVWKGLLLSLSISSSNQSFFFSSRPSLPLYIVFSAKIFPLSSLFPPINLVGLSSPPANMEHCIDNKVLAFNFDFSMPFEPSYDILTPYFFIFHKNLPAQHGELNNSYLQICI